MFSNTEVWNQVLSYLIIAIIIAFPKALFDIQKLKQTSSSEIEKLANLKLEIQKIESDITKKIDGYKDDTREAFREIKQDIKELNNLIKELLVNK